LIHAIRRNIDVTVLVHNNKVYGLTKGQASPTADQGMKTKIQHDGVIAETFNPISFSLALGAGFVARGFAGNKTQLKQLVTEAVNYKGFSIIDILQPCVSFNKINTHSWYKERVYDLKEENYSPDNLEKALKISMSGNDKIPTGIIYRQEKLSYTGKIKLLDKNPLINNIYNPEKLKKLISAG
jgi:2-oxoglutarate ferredoxin oxidoreductase subunit beta